MNKKWVTVALAGLLVAAVTIILSLFFADQRLNKEVAALRQQNVQYAQQLNDQATAAANRRVDLLSTISQQKQEVERVQKLLQVEKDNANKLAQLASASPATGDNPNLQTELENVHKDLVNLRAMVDQLKDSASKLEKNLNLPASLASQSTGSDSALLPVNTGGQSNSQLLTISQDLTSLNLELQNLLNRYVQMETISSSGVAGVIRSNNNSSTIPNLATGEAAPGISGVVNGSQAEKLALLPDAPRGWPVKGPITSPFGPRPVLFPQGQKPIKSGSIVSEGMGGEPSGVQTPTPTPKSKSGPPAQIAPTATPTYTPAPTSTPVPPTPVPPTSTPVPPTLPPLNTPTPAIPTVNLPSPEYNTPTSAPAPTQAAATNTSVPAAPPTQAPAQPTAAPPAQAQPTAISTPRPTATTSGASTSPTDTPAGTTFGSSVGPVPTLSGIDNNGLQVGPGMEFHTGIDIGVLEGTEVHATADGVVEYAGDQRGGYGMVIFINHAGGFTTIYGHNSRFLVKPGQTVKAGDLIALSGNTGYSTGPHVHYEIRYNGQAVDPAPFMS
jgi:murein DD-endopeptidase MepM/ murein hydrolase activator NlpD